MGLPCLKGTKSRQQRLSRQPTTRHLAQCSIFIDDRLYLPGRLAYSLTFIPHIAPDHAPKTALAVPRHCLWVAGRLPDPTFHDRA
jgi:hypothetical protein